MDGLSMSAGGTALRGRGTRLPWIMRRQPAVNAWYATKTHAMTESAEANLAALMVAAQDGDQPAYQALLRGCVPVAAATARRQGVPPDRVDDVVQDVLLTIHRARATYDPARPFLPWLRAIAKRRAIDSLRSHYRTAGREVYDEDAYATHADIGPAADAGLGHDDRVRVLAEAIKALPAGQRQAVEMLALGETSLEEASGRTGRSKGALKVNLHRAIQALRQSMSMTTMSDMAGVDALIGRLAVGLRPVKRLPSPWKRAAIWLAASVWVASVLALFTEWDTFEHRMLATPDMWLSFAGGGLTAILAAAAAFLTSVPGRPVAWAWLPAPALALWVGASIAGCVRLAPAPETVKESMMHPMLCIYFIMLIAIPLAVLLMLQLVRACPLRPGITAALGGLASAGAAATLLAFVHPFDATFQDLGAHAVAIALVVAAVKMYGEKRLSGEAPTLAPAAIPAEK